MVDRGVRIPSGLVVGEDPELDARRFRRTERGVRLITQPMIDQLLAHERRVRVLSVAVRGVPAGEDRAASPMSPARCPARSPPRASSVTHARARLSGGAGRAARSADGSRARRSLRRPARACWPRHARRLDLFVLDAPHLFARPGNPYLGPDGTRLDRQRAALRRARARRGAIGARRGRRASCPTSCTRTTGRPVSRRPTCTMAAARGPRPSSTVHNLAFQGLFAAELLRRARSAAGVRYAVDGVEYHGSIGFLKAGLAASPTASRPSRRPMPRRSARPKAAWGSTACCARAPPTLSRILNGIDDTRLEPGDRPAPGREVRRCAPRRAAANKAALQAQLGLDADPRALLLRRRQPADRAEGPRPAARGAAGAAARAARSSRCSARASRRSKRGFAAAAAAHPGRIGCVIGYDEALAHRIQAGATRCSCRRASSRAA